MLFVPGLNLGCTKNVFQNVQIPQNTFCISFIVVIWKTIHLICNRNYEGMQNVLISLLRFNSMYMLWHILFITRWMAQIHDKWSLVKLLVIKSLGFQKQTSHMICIWLLYIQKLRSLSEFVIMFKSQAQLNGHTRVKMCIFFKSCVNKTFFDLPLTFSLAFPVITSSYQRYQ